MKHKKPALKLKEIPFPDCYLQCALVAYLGAGECESSCPEKFKDIENESEFKVKEKSHGS